MPFRFPWFAVTLMWLVSFCAVTTSAVAVADESLVIRSRRLEIVLREDLNGFDSIVDRTTGRDYAAGGQEPTGLYRLVLGGGRQRTVQLSSVDAARRSSKPIDDGLELRFEHEGDLPLDVICRVSATEDDPMIRWQIRVVNRSEFPLAVAEYPRASLTVRLGDQSADDAIVYPSLEGVLLCDPARHFRQKHQHRTSYPGKLSAQFVYFFDPGGGFYSAAADGAGHTKDLAVVRSGDVIELTWAHRFPRVLHDETNVPYEVLWTCAEGTWQSGADVYRRWVERQPWCAKKLTQRHLPEWLRRTNVYLNFSARTEGVFFPASAAVKTFARYREFLRMPLVATAFSWERHGAWIGPEYFPPFGGDEYYIDLARQLAPHGDHLQVYTSGFRWGVKKPVTERRDAPRRYTDYDSTERFMAEGKPAAVVTAQGELSFSRPPWADNYALCPGSQKGHDLIADCFQRISDWGIAVVDLDQNLGAAVSDCFSTEHGHPPGAGVWQVQAMSRFLDGVLREARAKHPDSALGVEEPCEVYIPWFDLYHGRAFTDTRWPATGPGVVSIPLFIYLYHDYQIGYAGWIDSGFSPRGDQRMGLARAFLFGMQPGVRVHRGPFEINDRQPSEAMLMLRRVAHLMAKTPDYLLFGRMLHDPRVTGSPMLGPAGRKTPGRPPLPIPWPVIQATAWRSPEGNVCYALANLGDKPQSVRLEATTNGMPDVPVTLKRLGPEDETMLQSNVKLPVELPLELEPWEVVCIEQVTARAGVNP